MLTKKRFKHLTALLAFTLVVGGASSSGQSGRRGSKPAPAPSPQPVRPTPPDDGKPSVKLQLLIGTQHTKKRLPIEREIYESCLERLRQFSDVSFTEIGELGTDEAAKRARQDETSYVALVRFEIDVVQNSTLILNSRNLEVLSYVFEPKTGKRLVNDKTYYQPVGGEGTRTREEVGTASIKMTTKAAGISAAEQLRDGLWLALRAKSSVR